MILKHAFKGFLYVFFLVILLFQVGCHSTKRTSSQLDNSKLAEFKLRYNAIYNVDQVLKNAEDAMLREEIIWLSKSLFGEPDLKYEENLASAILKIQEILPKTADTDFKNNLYFRLGKAYYLKADYYSALEYFELADKNLFNPEILIWRTRALTRIGKAMDALDLVIQLKSDNLFKKVRSTYYAQKAEIFFGLNKSDSAMFYLEKALSFNPPKSYKKYWKLKAGEQLSVKNTDKAIAYLRKVVRSNSVPSGLKLQAEIELIHLQPFELEQQVGKFKALKKKGYTIGKEWQLDLALANLYNRNFVSDSAHFYFDKIIHQENTPLVLKSRSNWELAKLLVKENKYDLAESQIASIEANQLHFFDSKDRTLIINAAEWLDLLQHAEDTISTSFATYELARFYSNLGLKDEALPLVEKLNIENSNFDYLHLSAQLDTSDIELLNAKYTALILQRQQFYTIYSDLYTHYQLDSFQNVIVGVETMIKDSILLPKDRSRLAYLKAFAVGHSFPMDSLLKAFTEIVITYNQDRGIVERVNRHIDFIEKNKSAFANRKIALEKPKLLAVDLQQITQEEIRPQSTADTSNQKNGTFIDYQLPELEPYYFVVLIDDMKINLAPSRYGIGQFIRTRFPRQGYGHELSELDDSHQLIKVGVFENLETAKEFESKILNLLPQIIKIGEKKYSTFVIPKSILDMSEEVSFINDYIKKYIEN